MKMKPTLTLEGFVFDRETLKDMKDGITRYLPDELIEWS